MYPVLEGEVSNFIGPDGIGRNVGDDDPLFQVGGSAAATFARADRPWTDCRKPSAWNTRAGSMPKPLPVSRRQ